MAPRKASKPKASSEFYSKNPASKAKKDDYNKEFNTNVVAVALWVKVAKICRILKMVV